MSKNVSRLVYFIFGFAAAVFFLILTGIILIIIVTAGSKVVVLPNSYLEINFRGELKEKPQPDLPSFLNNGRESLELFKIIGSIQKAKTDPNIKGILINGDLISYSMAHIEEIGAALTDFREHKEVVSWISNGNNSNYALSLYADEISMPETESASLFLKGYSLTIPYLKGSFDKLGIEFTVLHEGSYKGSGENYVLNNMSDELKSSYSIFLDDYFNSYLSKISDKRELDKQSLYNLFNDSKLVYISPIQSYGLGLIDSTNDLYSLRKKINKRGWSNRISVSQYAKSINNQIRNVKVAVLYIDGTIINDYSGTSSFSNEDFVGALSIVNDIEKIRKDKSIRAVVLRINSPGGSALASELIYTAIEDLKKEKPVYSSFGPYAASGGYYIGCVGDKIFTDASTLTGSIGVVSIMANHEELNNKLGVSFETIKKFSMDDIFNSSRKPTDSELIVLKRSMSNIYSEFSSRVLKNRIIDREKFSQIAEGRVWTGNQAIDLNLADFKGGMIDTIEYAVKENGIGEYSIEHYPKAPGLFESLSSGVGRASLKLPAKLSKLLDRINFYSEHINTPILYETSIIEEK